MRNVHFIYLFFQISSWSSIKWRLVHVHFEQKCPCWWQKGEGVCLKPFFFCICSYIFYRFLYLYVNFFSLIIFYFLLSNNKTWMSPTNVIQYCPQSSVQMWRLWACIFLSAWRWSHRKSPLMWGPSGVDESSSNQQLKAQGGFKNPREAVGVSLLLTDIHTHSQQCSSCQSPAVRDLHILN